MRYHGTGTLTHDYGGVKATGQKLDCHGTAIFELTNGRIAEVWGHSDLAEWIAAQ
jgi:predicted ester cyclase